MKRGTGKNIEVEKPELEKRYQEIMEKKTPPQKKQQRKQKAKMQKHKQKNENAAGAKNENTEAEAEEVEGTCTGTMVNDGVETTGEAGERHLGLHTVN